jgi:hypothetical protein
MRGRRGSSDVLEGSEGVAVKDGLRRGFVRLWPAWAIVDGSVSEGRTTPESGR